MAPADKWLDRNAGPVVRPYALTGGRTEPAASETLDLITIVTATPAAGAGERAADELDLSPEERSILALCRSPVTVTDVTAATELPLGVVRVLLADLIARGQIAVRPPESPAGQPPAELLKEVLHGLRAL